MIRPLWIEVDLAALGKNLEVIRGFLKKDTTLLATIKQSAYGHGLLAVARELSNQGIDFFGVGGFEEAIALREDGFNGSILILTAVLDEFCGLFVRYNIIPTIAPPIIVTTQGLLKSKNFFFISPKSLGKLIFSFSL